MSEASSHLRRQTWKDASTVKLLALSFLGIAIQTVIYHVTFWPAAIAAAPTRRLDIPIDIFFIYFGINLGVSFAYALLASTIGYPKRIVSPFVMVVGAAAVTFILVVEGFTSLTSFISLDLVASFMFPNIVFYSVIGMFCWMLWFVLRTLVGLNGNTDDLEKQSYSITREFVFVRQVITDEYFLDDHNMKVEDEDEKTVILKSKSNAVVKMTIVLVRGESIPIIAFAGYMPKYDSMSVTPEVLQSISSIRNDIFARVRGEDLSIKITQLKTDNRALAKAISEALLVASSPFARFAKRVIATIGGLIFVAVLLALPPVLDRVTLGPAIAGWISIASVIVSLTVPTLKEGLKKSHKT